MDSRGLLGSAEGEECDENCNDDGHQHGDEFDEAYEYLTYDELEEKKAQEEKLVQDKKTRLFCIKHLRKITCFKDYNEEFDEEFD